MKRSLAVLLILTMLVATAFAACKTDGNAGTSEKESGGLESADNQFGLQDVEVTDKNGEVVTDADGKAVTTEVAVQYVVDKKGKTVAKVIDENGEVVTDKSGKEVTVKPDIELTTASKKKKTTKKEKTTESTKPTKSTTATTKGNEATTDKEITTLPLDKDKVPTIDDARKSKSKEAVTFSSKDQQVIKSMLEVPYLYNASYENADGVPINIAAHAALWMAEREGLNTTSYASGTIVLDLFKFFAQTVVNFKTQVNAESDNDRLVYNENNDSFSISEFETKKQDVTIQKIEYLGNNNYYLITGKVTGAGKIDHVYAIVQKNKLDATLGFSIKALKWS